MKRKFPVFFCAIVLVLIMSGFSGAAPVFVSGVSATTGWTDVNKAGDPYSGLQSKFCWAASAANMLAYTGWDGGPALKTAPAVYSDFVAHWNNDIGDSIGGIEWWFTGKDTIDSATLKNTLHTGFYSETLFLNNRTFREPNSQGDCSDNIWKTQSDCQSAGGTWTVKYPLVPTAGNPAPDGDATRLGWIRWYIQQNRGTSIAIKGRFTVSGKDYIHFLTVWGVDNATNTIYVTDSDRGNNTLDSYVIDGSLHLNGYYSNFVWTGLYGLLPNSANIRPTLRPPPTLEPPTILRFQ